MGWSNRQSTSWGVYRPHPVRSLAGKQQPQLPGLPSVLQLVLPPEDGFGEGKALAGEGKCHGGSQRRDRDVKGASWGGHGPQELWGVNRYEVHEDSFQPPG